MVDCLTLCNTSCITCIWFFLLSICCPKLLDRLEECDSSQECNQRPKQCKKPPPRPKSRRRPINVCCDDGRPKCEPPKRRNSCEEPKPPFRDCDCGNASEDYCALIEAKRQCEEDRTKRYKLYAQLQRKSSEDKPCAEYCRKKGC